MNLYNVYFASKGAGPRTVQIEALNQAGAKAQVEARYPGACNIILNQMASSGGEDTRLVIHLGDGFEGHKAWPAPSMDEFPNISGFNYRIARHKVGDEVITASTRASMTRMVTLVSGVNHHRTVNPLTL